MPSHGRTHYEVLDRRLSQETAHFIATHFRSVFEFEQAMRRACIQIGKRIIDGEGS